PDVEHAVAIRPADEEPTIRGEALELGLTLLARWPCLGEPARKHDGPAHAALDGGSEHARYLLGRNRHDDRVRGLGRRAEAGLAGHAEDAGVLRMDRKDPAAIAETLQVGDDPGRAGHPLRGADDS